MPDNLRQSSGGSIKKYKSARRQNIGRIFKGLPRGIKIKDHVRRLRTWNTCIIIGSHDIMLLTELLTTFLRLVRISNDE